MAKLKGPLFSLGASGQIGKVLVYFGWKGLDVVREYVVPANPNSARQIVQRGYFTACVTAIQAARALAAQPLIEADIVAYRGLAGLHDTPRTWFNEIVRGWLVQRVAGLRSSIFRTCNIIEQDGQLSADFYQSEGGANEVTAGNFWWGLSPTALFNSTVAVDQGNGRMTAIIPGLTNGRKYWVQFRPTLHADFVGVRSGLYIGTPSA